jgi:hypothetical protein
LQKQDALMNLGFLSKRVGKILTDVGSPMVLVCQSPTPYNPHQPDVPAFVEYECNGVITGPKRKRGEKRSSEDYQSIRVLLRADNLPDDVEPSAGDRLIIEGVSWNIVGNDPVKPANRHILHKLECKP